MERIGKYEIRRELGRGSSATVYLGHDPFAHRDVALKVVRPEALRDGTQGRLYTHIFLNEASLVGKLAHPHIVQIYDAVVADDLCYVVMEYVPGGTLEAACAPTRLLAIPRVVEIIFKCTRALDYAHRLGITHRDIKPANILCTGPTPERGDIKISDFGAAITGGTERTQIAGIGSPAYMSPEQVREEPLDQRTDIYSLGVVMYQLLSGQLPFQASSNYNMVYQIINTTPTPLRRLRPEIPEALAEIVDKAMTKSRAERYPSWDDFGHDLARAFREHQVQRPGHDLSDSEKFDTLRAMPFFVDFSDAELWEVLEFSEWRRNDAGSVVMRDGDQGSHFCFVAEGELKVTKNGRILNLLTAGDCFGEMAAISRHTPHTRSADVVVLTPARIVTIRSGALEAASDTCRMHFYQAFLDVLTCRLSLANQRLALG